MSNLIHDEQGQISPSIYAQIVSQTPGRIRFRLEQRFRNPQQINQLSFLLKKSLKVEQLTTNIQTGSVTIYYPQDNYSLPSICNILSEVGLIFQERIFVSSYQTKWFFPRFTLISGKWEL